MPLLKTEVISKSGFGKSMGEPHSHTYIKLICI